jgi:hypothetical protein
MDEDYDYSDTYAKRDVTDADEVIDYAEVERVEDTMADPTTIRERIDKALENLAQLKQRRDQTVSRTDIVDKLAK